MGKLFLPLLIISLLTPVTSSGKSSLKGILKELDTKIEEREAYVSEKQSRIRELQRGLKSGGDEYELNYSLFSEYKSFKYDSAYFYANRALELAGKARDNDRIAQARCALVFCYISSGLFLEAFDEMTRIDAGSIASTDIKVLYYSLYNRLYYDASDYNDTEGWSAEYTRKGTAYVDSVAAIIPGDSYLAKLMQAQKEIKSWNYSGCIALYRNLLEDYSLTEHDKAVVNSSIGGAFKELGQTDSSMIYLAKAAINDIVSATKETTALYRLAEMLCKEDDSRRAYTYINAAMEDADFYNARHRKLSINPILPIIEQARMDTVRRRIVSMWVIILLCATVIVLLVVLFRIHTVQRRKLEKKSRQLMEANRIKEEYIGYAFYINSEFLTETEDLYKTINYKINARQYDDLRDITKQSKINKKRESMHESFDKCFLNIFPSFIREYAALFPEGYIDPDSTVLTSEMRIFALIRLGITDSERISKFLNYSVHTIYTYKTRAKNKSIVDNEEFEKRIRSFEIG